ncbi:hypothetical protein PRIPAC_92330 [Pristionchus pacificus]|uniref:Tyrosine phosphatase n=1 Tax=Pristionchus pacificus TaxID=54126 RepID=A0A2A6CHB6_PRIPA|nr:hypothetical protein PRIPAC_92330 [Pristionchus pacificus]|eukprot:PDM77486.1 tyrosine phosphatase [Pristionchus pacificus]
MDNNGQRSAYYIDNDPRYVARRGALSMYVSLPPQRPDERAPSQSQNQEPTRAQPEPARAPAAQPVPERAPAPAVVAERPPTKEEAARMQSWAKKLHGLSCKKLSKEFEKENKRYLPPGLTTVACKTGRNLYKWRNAEVLCIDQTRVVLKKRGSDVDFIHANWMGSPAPGAVKYICTQAPFKETQEDFWHMCYTERASLVLMLCDFTEGSSGYVETEKCFRYFPQRPNETMKVGAYTVTARERLAQPVVADAVFRAIEIKCKDQPPVVLQHCLFRGWPESCAPVETDRVMQLWRWVKTHHAGRPVVVHSSTGSGRAATFCTIDYAIHRIAGDKHTKMIDVVKDLRRQRHAAIRSDVQFLYLHLLVLDAMVMEKAAKPYSASKFVAEYKKYTQNHTARCILRVLPKPVEESSWYL